MNKLYFIVIIVLFPLGLSAQSVQETEKDSVTSDSTYFSNEKYFCPDSTMCKTVEYLKECSCLKNKGSALVISESGQKIIETGYRMTVVTKQILKGSCWQFIDEVYRQAGFPMDKRTTVFKSVKSGPYVDSKMIQPGDWIYHVNYSFHGVEHSAIFICWKDFDKKIAITLGHLGQNLAKTGIYGEFDLKSVYYITRPKK